MDGIRRDRFANHFQRCSRGHFTNWWYWKRKSNHQSQRIHSTTTTPVDHSIETGNTNDELIDIYQENQLQSTNSHANVTQIPNDTFLFNVAVLMFASLGFIIWKNLIHSS
ncbi:hypothetical protein I4U23_004887 [Adineta vaga]|nr:hypothetical protein I4U23_004887 [Adineta vaga]